jgi:ABC-type Co2+ transport system permease subunit
MEDMVMDGILAFLKAFASGPVLKPLLALLNSKAVLSLIAGILAFIVVPQIPNLTPDRIKTLGDLVFSGAMLLVGRFSLEGVLTTRAQLPTTAQDYVRQLFEELMKNWQTQQAAVIAASAASLVVPTPAPEVKLSADPVAQPNVPPREGATG